MRPNSILSQMKKPKSNEGKLTWSRLLIEADLKQESRSPGAQSRSPAS